MPCLLTRLRVKRSPRTPWATQEEVEQAIARADAGFRQWRSESVARRAQKLRDLGAALRHRAEEMARMMSREMGKPVLQARAEVANLRVCVTGMRNTAQAMLNAEPTQVENHNAVIEYRPLGRFWR